MTGLTIGRVLALQIASQVLFLMNAAIANEQQQSLFVWKDSTGHSLSITTTDEWIVQRKLILQRVQEVMGDFPQPKRTVPLLPIVVSDTKERSFDRKHVSYHTDSLDYRVHSWLLVPSSASHKTPLPAVLCLHQTTDVGKDEPAGLAGDPKLAYARELAERGFVVLVPDYPSFGDYEYDFESDDYASGSMKAIYDNVRAVDYLTTLPVVNDAKIGVIGHSLGGHNSIFTAVFEPRLKVIVSSCGFTEFEKYYQGDLTGWTSQRYMPRILERYRADPAEMPFRFSDLVAALAPRPFLAVAPVHDHNFDVSGVRDVMSAASPIYRLHDSDRHFQASYPNSQHEFPIAQRRIAYQFLAEHLSQSPKDPR